LKKILLGIPYENGKDSARYLTCDEFNRILSYFYQKVSFPYGLRNLVLIMMFGFLGLRLQSIIGLNKEDIDLVAGLVVVKEKGGKKRSVILPTVLCAVLERYLDTLGKQNGPLFLSKLGKRIHERTLQDIFRSAAIQVGIEKTLHAHIFRHTAATHLTIVAGVDITQHVLGHAQRKNTLQYTHLNPNEYALYMKTHLYEYIRRMIRNLRAHYTRCAEAFFCNRDISSKNTPLCHTGHDRTFFD